MKKFLVILMLSSLFGNLTNISGAIRYLVNGPSNNWEDYTLLVYENGDIKQGNILVIDSGLGPDIGFWIIDLVPVGAEVTFAIEDMSGTIYGTDYTISSANKVLPTVDINQLEKEIIEQENKISRLFNLSIDCRL